MAVGQSLPEPMVAVPWLPKLWSSVPSSEKRCTTSAEGWSRPGGGSIPTTTTLPASSSAKAVAVAPP
jgi:hypothetical protein